MSGTIKSCKRCSRLFSSYGSVYCSECSEELDKIFGRVQDYIFEHENAGLMEISKALDIDGQIILEFIKDGSLSLSEGHYALTCERCHKPISSGRYCDDCKEVLSKTLNIAASAHKKTEKKEERKPKSARMHIRHDD